MTTATAFGLSLTESGHATDAPSWNLGFEAQIKKTGTLTAMYWSPPADASGTVGWRVYGGTVASPGSLLGSGTFASYVDAGGWQRFAIAPISVSALDRVMPCVRSSTNGDYAFKSGVFPTTGTGFDTTQGCFKAGSDAIPDTTTALLFMLDAELTYVDSVTGELVVTSLAATMSAAGSALAAGALAGVATPATLGLAGAAGVTGVLAGVATAATLALNEGNPCVVTRPFTGSVSRPNTGVVSRPGCS